MSAANIIGNGPYAGTVSSENLLKASGVATMAIGAPSTVSVPIPYMKSTDTVILSMGVPAVAGGAIAAISYTVANSGLQTASMTLSATVAGNPVAIVYQVFAGVM